jgi:hypothetical protein
VRPVVGDRDGAGLQAGEVDDAVDAAGGEEGGALALEERRHPPVALLEVDHDLVGAGGRVVLLEVGQRRHQGGRAAVGLLRAERQPGQQVQRASGQRDRDRQCDDDGCQREQARRASGGGSPTGLRRQPCARGVLHVATFHRVGRATADDNARRHLDAPAAHRSIR